MLLHLGNGHMVVKAHIAFILDYQECLNNKSSEFFFNTISKQAETIIIADEPVKSLIYTQTKDKKTLYLSPISTGTLLKRSNEQFWRD